MIKFVNISETHWRIGHNFWMFVAQSPFFRELLKTDVKIRLKISHGTTPGNCKTGADEARDPVMR